MSEFLAEAQIVLRANTKLFLADFEKAVKKAEATKVTVTVRASMTGFRADLIEKLKSSSRGLSVSVRVKPDMTGFRAALQTEVDRASRGIVASTKAAAATPVAATATGAAPAARAASRALTAEQAVAKAVEAGAFARKRVTGLIDIQDQRLARIARQEAAITAAQTAQTRAIQEQNAALQIQATKIEQRARAELAVTQGAFSKTQATRTAPATADALARQQAEASAARQKADAEASTKRIATAEAEAKRLVGIEAKRAADIEKINARLAEVRAVVAQPILPPERGNIAALRKQQAEFTKAATVAKKALEAATVAGIAITDKDTVGLTAHATALARDAGAALEDARAQKLRAAAIVRASIAQAASAVGLRGAALTAATPFIVTSAALIAIGKSVSLASKLQSELAVFNVTAGATADQMETVREKALALGRDVTLPAVSAGDAAVALTELAKAGLSVQDSLDGAKGVLQLATAANIDFSAATQLTASALNAFGLAGLEATHVADVLANSANRSQGSITDAGVALQQSSAVARQAGLSLEQTAAALTLFARAGLRGSDAGTSLRTALIRLINPSTKASALIQKLGLHIRDASGNINLNVFDEFTQKTKEFSAAQRDQALAIIFGQDAIRGAAILAREGRKGLDAELQGINKQGTAAEVAAARTSGFAGSIENLKNQLSDAGEALGSSLLPQLTILADSMANAIHTTTRLVEGIADLTQLAEKPIDIVVNVIRKVTGGGGGGSGQGDQETKDSVLGRIKKIFSPSESGIELADDLNTLGIELGTKLDEGFQSALKKAHIPESIADNFRFTPGIPTLDQAKDKIDDIIAALRKSPGPTGFNEAVLALQDLQKSLQGGGFEAKKLAEDIGPLITQLQNLGSQNAIHIPMDIVPGKGLTSETLNFLQREGEEGGKLTAEAFSAGFLGSVEDIGKQGAEALKNAAKSAVDPGVAGAFEDAGKKVKKAFGQATGFERAQTQAEISGDVQAQIKALQGKAEAERRAIAAINRVTGGAPTGARLEARTKAEDALNQALSSIQSLQDQQTSDAKQKAADIKKGQDDADQAVLDALAPAARRLDTRALIAGGTKSLKDDIAVAKAQQEDNRHQIAVIFKSFNDRKAAGEKIADLKDDNIRLSQQIVADTKSIFQAAQDAFQTKIDTATAAGAIDKVIALTKQRITKLEHLIETSKGEREALKAYRSELAKRRQELESLTDDRLQARTDFAQSVFDLTGNKNPLLKAINAQIKEAQQDARQAKRGSVAWLKAMTEVKTLQKRKKDLLDEAKDATKDHTTAFDLLNEFNAKFNDIAGNVVNTNQPFAGSSAFSTDIVNKAIAGFQQGGLPHRPIDIRLRGDDQQSKQISVTEKLIAVIQENTDVLRGGAGNRSTQSVFVPGEIEGKNKLAAFWASRTAREVANG